MSSFQCSASTDIKSCNQPCPKGHGHDNLAFSKPQTGLVLELKLNENTQLSPPSRVLRTVRLRLDCILKILPTEPDYICQARLSTSTELLH